MVDGRSGRAEELDVDPDGLIRVDDGLGGEGGVIPSDEVHEAATEVVVGEKMGAALVVMHDRDLEPGAGRVDDVGQIADVGQIVQHVRGDPATGVADDHGVAELELEKRRRVGARVQAGDHIDRVLGDDADASRASVVAKCLLRSSSGSRWAMPGASFTVIVVVDRVERRRRETSCLRPASHGKAVRSMVWAVPRLRPEARRMTDPEDAPTTVTEHEAEQIAAANASGRAPVVFVHGLWLLASSWDRWADLFREAGYTTLQPGWPDDPETSTRPRPTPTCSRDKTIGQVADHYDAVIAGLGQEARGRRPLLRGAPGPDPRRAGPGQRDGRG